MLKPYDHIDIEAREKAGRDFFLQGYNCAQSVVAAFCDLFTDDRDTMLRMAASFGGGMARLRLTCGTVSGMAMMAGLECGSPMPGNMPARTANYALVQQLAAAFKQENDSLVCRELLGLRTGQVEPPCPSERTADYYRQRPCPMLVSCACRIYAQHLQHILEH